MLVVDTGYQQGRCEVGLVFTSSACAPVHPSLFLTGRRDSCNKFVWCNWKWWKVVAFSCVEQQTVCINSFSSDNRDKCIHIQKDQVFYVPVKSDAPSSPLTDSPQLQVSSPEQERCLRCSSPTDRWSSCVIFNTEKPLIHLRSDLTEDFWCGMARHEIK